jgi:hypothetical protein
MKLKYGSFGLTFISLLTTLLIGIGLIMLVSCEDNIIEPIPDSYTMELNGRLDTTNDGFYKLKLNSSNNSVQTIHRITGQLLNNGKEPNPPQLVEWESSHSWTVNDTAYVFIRRTVNYLGNWVNVDTIYVTGFGGSIVPTINEFSYSGTDGEINTVMVGDTMIVKARFKDLEKTIRIILE